jgi:ubiquinone/menaquinone biosynthesis C-methylase UbiE
LSGPPPADPLDRIKQGAKWLWSQGDYARVAAKLEPEAAALASACIAPRMKALDIAAGNGNFALAAARLGATVTASDITPHMVELGRQRSEAGGLRIEWLEADAESLPFEDRSFDVAASVFGAMFAPRPDRVAAEMFRVVRPGGAVAMANYGSGGYLGRLSEILTQFSTAPGLDLPSPFLWGDPAVARKRFEGLASSVEIEPRTLTLAYDSLESWRTLFAQTNPPLMALKVLLPEAAYASLIDQSQELVEELNVGRDGHIVLESSYLVVIARK